ncbi:sensor histidine kinase, partial [Roseateles sp.]|uniref:sensor histidine kinase n=1 Tax=Roseateles sp. TaxID=1971397 RepID=UPI002E030F74|nr:sensor histidine kinase [Roseateles sp.]
LFREHVRQQFIDRLGVELDQVTARLEADADGRPALDPARLSDPRWTRPRSGLYWQVDGAGPGGEPALLRSRSLWDEQLAAPRDMPADRELHVHELPGPGQVPLLLIERTLRAEGAQAPWRVMVAADLRPLEQAGRHFDGVLAWSLLALLLLLAAAALLQVTIGLAPLGRLRLALSALREGRTQRLEGRYPDEIQPLVNDLNGVLDRHAEVLERARAQAGNLAHALKTPLTVLSQAAGQAQGSEAARAELPALVAEQVLTARRHVDWHLARARAAAAQGVVGLRTPVLPVAEGLVKVMRKVHAARLVAIVTDLDERLAFAGETQDLQEMLGNLLDNACRSARTQVLLSGMQAGRRLRITLDDDGPGIPEARIEEALRRGGRLDESTPGSGLGLAIVQELARLYGGSLELSRSPIGGLLAVLTLPSA